MNLVEQMNTITENLNVVGNKEEKETIKTIPSYEVAEMMQKKHWEVLRMLDGGTDRKGIIEILNKNKICVSDYFIANEYKDNSGKMNKYYECTKLGCDMLATKLKNKDSFLLAEKLRSVFSYKDKSMIFLNLEREEIEFIDKLEGALKPFSIKGERQYSVLGYRIDYYISSLKIAIEYDENNHSNYLYNNQEGRQKKIEKKLGCRFIRVSNDKSHSYNIGLVIKNIFSL